MIEKLRERFEITQAVSVEEGRGGMPLVRLQHPSGTEAEVYLHGAHVTSWKAATGEELLFVSRESHFEEGKAIRGGIPVVFPQFGAGTLPQHGFARTSAWEIAGSSVAYDGQIVVTLRLQDTPATMAIWPHKFLAELTVALQKEGLEVSVSVRNQDVQPFCFQTALHTYFQVADITAAAVEGLKGAVFVDSLQNDAKETERRAELRFAHETDRVYVNAPDTLRIHDDENGRVLTIRKEGMPDVVVWNPWVEKSQRMADFGDREYTGMLCVETGAIQAPVQLQPGERYKGRTTFTARLTPAEEQA